MDGIPQHILALSDQDLKQKLIENGLTAPILSPSIRKICQRKLAKKLGVYETTSDVQHNVENTGNHTESPLPSSTTPQSFNGWYAVTYYAIDVDQSAPNGFLSEVFQDEKLVKKYLKQNKGARFKRFTSKQQAENHILKEKKNYEELPASSTALNNSGLSCGDCKSSESQNAFSTPKQFELNKLMQAIEKCDEDVFNDNVWSNPKFLINSSDCPSILKPNCRYNALHVAAKFNQSGMIKLILDTLRNKTFYNLMYPLQTDLPDSSKDTFINHIIDLYCNTPEKILFETPLHLACKFGFLEVVSELISSGCCNKDLKNKYNQTAMEIICERDKLKDTNKRSQIRALFEEQFYIPLIRSHDDSKPPSIGQPWVPNSPNTKPLTPDVRSPLDPVSVVSAVAGPMTSDEARMLCKKWRTPEKGKFLSNLQKSDLDRGNERVGRELAKSANVPWLEYWEFLGTYTDFSTTKGLQRLEKYLQKKFDKFPMDEENSQPTSGEGDSLDDICLKMDGMQINSSSDGSYYSTSNSPPPQLSRIIDDNPAMNIQEKRIEDMRCALLLNRQHQLSKFNSVDINRNEASTSTTSFRPIENITSPKTPDKFFASPIRSGSISGDEFLFSSPVRNHLGSPCSRRFSCEVSHGCFLIGSEPSKVDRDVLIAIGGADLNPMQYPLIRAWKKCVESFTKEDQLRWRTPRRKIQNRLTLPMSPIAFPAL